MNALRNEFIRAAATCSGYTSAIQIKEAVAAGAGSFYAQEAPAELWLIFLELFYKQEAPMELKPTALNG